MNYAMMNHTDCVASTMTGNPCPTNEIQLFMHHISSIQIFSIAVIPPISTLLFIVFSLLAYACFIFINKLLYSPPFLLLYNKYRQKILGFRVNIFLSWLSLFELSPSILK